LVGTAKRPRDLDSPSGWCGVCRWLSSQRSWTATPVSARGCGLLCVLPYYRLARNTLAVKSSNEPCNTFYCLTNKKLLIKKSFVTLFIRDRGIIGRGTHQQRRALLNARLCHQRDTRWVHFLYSRTANRWPSRKPIFMSLDRTGSGYLSYTLRKPGAKANRVSEAPS
jgi:hypothetical protein